MKRSNDTSTDKPEPSQTPEAEELPAKLDDRDLLLTMEEARGGSPADVSVGGEEDAGVGLEFLVRSNLCWEKPHAVLRKAPPDDKE